MISQNDMDFLTVLLHSPDISDTHAEALLSLMRAARTAENQTIVEQGRAAIAISDRDNRRRRMDIARVILDESVVLDLDAIVEVICPAEDVSQNFRRGMATATVHSSVDLEVSGEPVVSDPTQVPTPEPCGYKEQLASRLWKCTRPRGHEGHHHLDDGTDIVDDMQQYGTQGEEH